MFFAPLFDLPVLHARRCIAHSFSLLPCPAQQHFFDSYASDFRSSCRLSLPLVPTLQHSQFLNALLYIVPVLTTFKQIEFFSQRKTGSHGKRVVLHGQLFVTTRRTRLTKRADTRRAWAWRRSERVKRRAGWTRANSTEATKLRRLVEFV